MHCHRLSVSFQCSVDLLVLHSFPTRRSSDLLVAGVVALVEAGAESNARAGTRLGHLPAFGGCPGDGLLDQDVLRSEEHTSELQSQFHLVCRLLLEKKKKKQQTRHSHPSAAPA